MPSNTSYPKLPTEDAVRELAMWRGETLQPRQGCQLTAKILGDASVWCEYEYIPAEAPRPNADLPNPGPGFPAEIVILQVLINGRMCYAEDVIPSAILEQWREEIEGEHT